MRPGELRTAVWADIDLNNAEWRYRVTKTEIDHIVPLSRQTLAILRPLYDLTGQGTYVFPGARSRRRPMSDNAILVALRAMEIGKDEMTGHGFRAVARTLEDRRRRTLLHEVVKSLCRRNADPSLHMHQVIEDSLAGSSTCSL